MIQRVQTIWLLLACISACLSIKFPFYTGHLITDSLNSLTPLNAFSFIPIGTLTLISGAGSLITIFLFKNRKRQMMITMGNLILSIIIIALYFLEIKENYRELNIPLITCVFVFIVPIFVFLAFRGIYKDNRLVRSVDRLR